MRHRTASRQPAALPAVPAALAKELSVSNASIPGYVSILPNSFIDASRLQQGFLGAGREPLTVGNTANFDPTTAASVSTTGRQSRQTYESTIYCRRTTWMLSVSHTTAILECVAEQLRHSQSRGGAAATHETVYRRAMQLAENKWLPLSISAKARRSAQPLWQRSLWSRLLDGQAIGRAACLSSKFHSAMAQQDSLGIVHADNFNTVKRLSSQLSTLESTALGFEEARAYSNKPQSCGWASLRNNTQINEMGGRDHFPNAWSCVLAGPGSSAVRPLRKTSDDGMEVTDGPVTAPEFLATLCRACRRQRSQPRKSF